MHTERPIKVCVAKSRPYRLWETFILEQVRRLPAEVEVLSERALDTSTDGVVAPVPGPVKRLSRLLDSRLGPVWAPLDARRLARYLRRRHVDVVLAQFGPTGVRLAPACALARVPLVVHFHGYDAYNLRALRRWGWAYGRMFARCAAVVAVSRHMRRRLVELGAPPEKVHLCPCGVDCSLFTPTDPGANPPLFVSVARFVPVKGHDYTLRAFRLVLDACRDARLRLVGDGPLLQECRTLASELGLDGAVEFTGKVPNRRLPELLHKARAFVMHSVRTPEVLAEGSPVVLREAGACGLSAVVSRCGGTAEVVLDGLTGFVVEQRDVEGMARAMLRLAQDPDLARRMGQAARRRIEQEFNIEKTIGRLWQVLYESSKAATQK